MIIMTGATVNNNSAIKAADDHGIRLITIKRWESISQLFRLMLLKYVFVSTITWSSAMAVDGFRAFDHRDTVVLLHTSGTSGN
jgi:hypothetical protein